MKDLPEHEPRSDSWERIMLKKNFDSQLIKNLGELPAYDPSDTAWSSIEKRLDNTKRRIIWRPIGIAASIFGLLILAFFLVRQENVKVDSQQPKIAWTSKTSLPTASIEQEERTDSLNETITATTDKKPTPEIITKSSRRSEFVPTISTRPPISISDDLTVKGMDLEVRGKYDPNVQNTNETYHLVAISWGLDKIKFQVKTNFGAQDPILLESISNEKGDFQARIILNRKK
ncbi:hypothetical protein SAMN04488104_100936 [Algoriphagus faecimaris]|uniref:Uncharacterized protein n=1 Tax=Algoriphagus faecimaris TaxID=686796 RepID=A0A1G6QGR3_9BACT|nr:hypothetical protein [Algoriphagus faecimaris]SDC91114.1 hypothetical protein SAMN04488104_100936 [Algoriphagus faecimaris]